MNYNNYNVYRNNWTNTSNNNYNISLIFQRRSPKNEDNPVYKGGPRPPRGMQPPIIIHDMQAMKRNREENFREARRRERERLQEEARQTEENCNLQLRRQSACDRDLQPCIDLEVQPEQARSNEGKVATLRKIFEVPHEQSSKKRNKPGFSAGRLGREGIYAEIDETRMQEFESPEQRHDTITRTVVYV